MWWWSKRITKAIASHGNATFHSLPRASRTVSLAYLLVAVGASGMSLAASPAPAAATHASERVPVLMYHQIRCATSETRLPHLWVCPAVFDATMAKLKANGWDTLTARQVANRLRLDIPIPAKTFVIVIDDGDRGGYENGYPILEKYGFEAVFAVVVGRVSIKERAMTWDELRELEANGHEIGNHTLSHANVGSPTVNLYRQIERSSQILAANLGHRPSTFVYPYGSYSQAAVDQVRRSGFRVAYTTEYGCTFTWRDRLLEERIRINRSDSPADVLRKVAPCA